MTTISLKLPDHLLERLEEECRSRRATKSAVLRDCLEKALTAPQARGESSCYRLAQDLAGSVKGLPRDIAVNPKYLRGFGE